MIRAIGNKLARAACHPGAFARATWSRAKLKLSRWSSGRPFVLVCRYSGIGDIICTFPAVLALRAKHPHARIVYHTRSEFVPIVRMGRCADDVIGSQPHFSPLTETTFDFVYRPRLGDELSPKEPVPYHMIDRFCEQLDVQVTDRQPRLWVPNDALTLTAAAMQGVREPRKPVVIIHIGPSWAVREWTVRKWERLVAMLTEHCGAVVLQLGSDVDTTRGPVKAHRIAGTIDWVGKWSLEETAAVIKQSDLFVGIDSGVLHVAGAVGTPCVGLFGAVDGNLRLHPSTPSIGVSGSVACLGCHHKAPRGHWESGCPNDIVCMQNLSAGAVFESCRTMLESFNAGVPQSTMVPGVLQRAGDLVKTSSHPRCTSE